MIVAEEVRIASALGTLAAKTWGDPGLPPLLALHGWLDNAGSFDTLAPLFARTHFVVAPDFRGHGRSPHLPAGAWYHFVDYLDDVDAIYAHFDWSCATLLGHSLGGAVASLFSALRPQRVGRLLLVEALGPLTSMVGETLETARRGLDQRAAFPSRRPLRRFTDMDDAIEARRSVGGISALAARPIVERGVSAVDGTLQWSSDPRLTVASAQRFTEDQVLALLAGIAAPTTLVLAEPATRLLPGSIMAIRATQVARLEIQRLPGGHHLHLDDPAAVFAALADHSTPA